MAAQTNPIDILKAATAGTFIEVVGKGDRLTVRFPDSGQWLMFGRSAEELRRVSGNISVLIDHLGYVPVPDTILSPFHLVARYRRRTP